LAESGRKRQKAAGSGGKQTSGDGLHRRSLRVWRQRQRIWRGLCGCARFICINQDHLQPHLFDEAMSPVFVYATRVNYNATAKNLADFRMVTVFFAVMRHEK
jgi:hypothetical protein